MGAIEVFRGIRLNFSVNERERRRVDEKIDKMRNVAPDFAIYFLWGRVVPMSLEWAGVSPHRRRVAGATISAARRSSGQPT